MSPSGPGPAPTTAHLDGDKHVKWVRLTKPSPGNPTPEIDLVGGLEGDVPWSHSLEEAIVMIDAGGRRFFTEDAAGRRAEVRVERGDVRRKPYLRTTSDDSLQNNLRALPSVGEYFRTFTPAVKDRLLRERLLP